MNDCDKLYFFDLTAWGFIVDFSLEQKIPTDRILNNPVEALDYWFEHRTDSPGERQILLVNVLGQIAKQSPSDQAKKIAIQLFNRARRDFYTRKVA